MDDIISHVIIAFIVLLGGKKLSQQGSRQAVETQDHGLKKHDIKVSTVVFMIFCLVAAGCYGIEEMIPECGPGLTIIMLCVLPLRMGTAIWAGGFRAGVGKTAGRWIL